MLTLFFMSFVAVFAIAFAVALLKMAPAEEPAAVEPHYIFDPMD